MPSSEEKSDNSARRAKSRAIKRQVMMSPILSKGHAHSVKKYVPRICHDCKGTGWSTMGFECYTCCGEGQL